MNWWQRLRSRGRLEDELDAELRFHFDQLVADYMAEGLPERDALRRARQEFGGVEAIKDDCRDARGTRWAHDLAQDVRFSARLLLKDRSFTVIAVLALALGVGVNNTLFTVVNALCIRGLPVEAAGRVVDISNRDRSGRPMPLSRRQFEDLLASSPSAIDAMSAYVTRPAILRDDQIAAERVAVGHVSTNAFAVIRQRPLIGREFRDDEAQGSAAVVILAADLWKSRYGADPHVVGRLVRLDGAPVTIIGVMPDGFRFPDNADAWRPIAAFQAPPDARVLGVFARLSADGTVAQARDSVAATLSSSPAAPGTTGALRATAVPINDRYVGDITNPAWIAFITVGLLLVVIACSNVANLLLARGARRGREMAIRLSLGATRARIVTQLLVESAILAAAGGAGAVAVSAAGNRLLSAAIPPGGLPYWVRFTMDGRVAVALATVCMGTVLLFGLAPALQLARTSVNAVIKQTAAAVSQDRAAKRWTWLFLTCQLALTVVLLSKLDVTVQTYRALQTREPLVDAGHILTFATTLPSDLYNEPERRLAFYRTLGQRLIDARGAISLSVASALPLTPGGARAIVPEGQVLSDSSPRVRTVSIDAMYFRTLGFDVIDGRPFLDDGGRADAGAAIVNQRFADLAFPGQRAVGQRIQIGSAPGSPEGPIELRTIVGVVPSVRQDPGLEPEPAVYTPLSPAAMSNAVVLVRTKEDAASLAAAVRDEVVRIDPSVPVNRLMTLADANQIVRWNARVSVEIITTIALIALGLATLGLAALTAHAVTQRSRELGIRLALGATSGGVVRLVLERVTVQALAGVAIGCALAKAWDPTISAATLLGTSGLVIAVVIGISSWPAARAARIDPLAMLRES